MKSILMAVIASIASIPAQAATIGITYSNAGDLTGPPVLNGTILTLDALANGSILSSNPALNAIWNPVTFRTHDFLDIITGLDNGTFVLTFANGEILSGNLFEADSAALLATNIGPFTQRLTFTGGTGRFAGASGSVSGGGLVGDAGFTTSGSGTLTAAGVSAPEPASVALIFGGLLMMVASRKQRQMKNLLHMLSLALGITSAAFGQGGTFTSIDFPGASSTIAWSNNKSGDIVGSYTIGGVNHGFKLTGGRFTTIDYPGAANTDFRGINNRGDISGIYRNADGVFHGFLLGGDKFTALDFPNATSTQGWGLIRPAMWWEAMPPPG